METVEEAFLGFARPNHSVILITFSIPINYFFNHLYLTVDFFPFSWWISQGALLLMAHLYCIAQVYYIPTANILILVHSF